VPVLEVALKRQAYGIKPIDAGLIAEQQKLADTFFALGLIPKAITVSELARKSGT
jgi:sulfonate transport system substrate-binding protein